MLFEVTVKEDESMIEANDAIAAEYMHAASDAGYGPAQVSSRWPAATTYLHLVPHKGAVR